LEKGGNIGFPFAKKKSGEELPFPTFGPGGKKMENIFKEGKKKIFNSGGEEGKFNLSRHLKELP